MIRHSSPKRISEKRLKENGGKMPFSTIRKSFKPIPQENVEATKRRRARNAKRMRSPEYKAARAGAWERSGGRCEHEELRHFEIVRLDFDTGKPVEDGRGRLVTDRSDVLLRCPETKCLQFHEERYRKVGPVTADDGKIYCIPHHRLAESKKMHKWGKRGFA